MIRKRFIASSIVLFTTVLIGCKPTAKHASSADTQSKQGISVQAESTKSVGKRINVTYNANISVPKDSFDKERMHIASEWLDAARDVAYKSQLKEPQNIALFIRANGVISKPHQDLLITIGFSQGITQNHFRIVPIVESDMGQPIARTYAPEGMAGRYSPSIKVLWLRNAPLSKFGKGLLLLHEGAHVLQTDPSYQGEGGWCNAEYDAFGIQANVLRVIGGKPYNVILLSQANTMLAHYRKSGGKIALPEYDSRYNAIFGKPQSVSEISMRRTLFGIHALYTMLNGMSSGPGKSAFVQRGVCQMYENIIGDGIKAPHGN